MVTDEIKTKIENPDSIFSENSMLYDAIHDFSIKLRNGSNPADIS